MAWQLYCAIEWRGSGLASLGRLGAVRGVPLETSPRLGASPTSNLPDKSLSAFLATSRDNCLDALARMVTLSQSQSKLNLDIVRMQSAKKHGHVQHLCSLHPTSCRQRRCCPLNLVLDERLSSEISALSMKDYNLYNSFKQSQRRD